jgi:hypothetical protein
MKVCLRYKINLYTSYKALGMMFLIKNLKPSSQMKSANVSEEHFASIFWVQK